MSKQQRVLQVLRGVVPPLVSGSHKGQAGKIGVIGGCFEYTGAPYFSSISALRTGADLSHVFCDEAAAVAIKSYSPDLIVHPVLPSSRSMPTVQQAELASRVQKVVDWFSRLHVLVIGPGLGRDPVTLDCVSAIIVKAKDAGLPLVIDGDGLSIVASSPSIIKGYSKAVLTPNVNEYKRLSQATTQQILKSTSTTDTTGGGEKEVDGELTPEVLANALGNVTIVRKGFHDVITDGATTLVCEEEGSLRRVGGQGDILTGNIAAFLAWSSSPTSTLEAQGLTPTLVSGYGGCLVTRTAGRLAFAKHHRATITSDMLQHLGEAFETHFPSENTVWGE